MAEAPKIQIDSDWKAQAQAEKQKLAEKAKEAPSASPGAAAGQRRPGAGAAAGELPPADFQTLLSTMATQALFALGAFPDPRTGQRVAHLDLARHHIDMLGVIEEKTKGNLGEEEADALTTTLYELRQRYVQIAAQSRERA